MQDHTTVSSRHRVAKKVCLRQSLPPPCLPSRNGRGQILIGRKFRVRASGGEHRLPCLPHLLSLRPQLPSQIPIKVIFQGRSRREKQLGSRVTESRGVKRRLCLDGNDVLMSMSLVCHSSSQRAVAPPCPPSEASGLNLCPLAVMYSFPKRGRKFLCLTQ